MSNQPLDFTKVESLRRHMLLTTGDMSELLGVTRMTYYGWLKGKPLRAKNELKDRTRLRQLLSIMATLSWPMPEVIASNQKQRKARLLELLEE
jgi:hypothetical protein